MKVRLNSQSTDIAFVIILFVNNFFSQESNYRLQYTRLYMNNQVYICYMKNSCLFFAVHCASLLRLPPPPPSCLSIAFTAPHHDTHPTLTKSVTYPTLQLSSLNFCTSIIQKTTFTSNSSSIPSFHYHQNSQWIQPWNHKIVLDFDSTKLPNIFKVVVDFWSCNIPESLLNIYSIVLIKLTIPPNYIALSDPSYPPPGNTDYPYHSTHLPLHCLSNPNSPLLSHTSAVHSHETRGLFCTFNSTGTPKCSFWIFNSFTLPGSFLHIFQSKFQWIYCISTPTVLLPMTIQNIHCIGNSNYL